MLMLLRQISPMSLANTNYLSITGQEITGGTVPLSSGGTGATTAAAARTALGVDASGTDNSTDVTLANTNYLSIRIRDYRWNRSTIKWWYGATRCCC